MNDGRPYLQMWRGVWVSFCKIAIVSFLSVKYRSDGLYCRMTGTPSSPTETNLKTQLSQPPSISRGKRPGPAVLVGITGLLVVVSMDRSKQQTFFEGAKHLV